MRSSLNKQTFLMKIANQMAEHVQLENLLEQDRKTCTVRNSSHWTFSKQKVVYKINKN